MKVVVIIPAAGLGTRMAPVPVGAKGKQKKAPPSKQFTELGGTPILVHTLRKFAAIDGGQRDLDCSAGKRDCRVSHAARERPP